VYDGNAIIGDEHFVVELSHVEHHEQKPKDNGRNDDSSELPRGQGTPEETAYQFNGTK
jgi:hypothetical protein